MSGPSDGSRVERILEHAFGALSDWLELVRSHENERRVRAEVEARARRDAMTRLVMVVLGAATLALFFWLGHR